MSDLGEVVDVNAVRFVRVFPGPPELLWGYLTECGKLTAWFGEDGRIEPHVGGSVWLMKGHIRGVVTQWKPRQRLAYTWNVFEPGDDESNYPESYLSLELERRGEDVMLTLFHLPVPKIFVPQTQMGWHTFLDMVDAGLAGKRPQSRTAYMEKNAARYGVDLQNLAR